MHLTDILADLGANLAEDATIVSPEDVYSSLDNIRRLSYCNDRERLGVYHPTLASDNLDPSGYAFYESKEVEERPQVGKYDVSARYSGMRVLGGCIMQTKHVSVPVTILFSRTHRCIAIHAERAPLATLEAELYAHPHSSGPKFEESVLPTDDVQQSIQRHKDVVARSRSIGFQKATNQTNSVAKQSWREQNVFNSNNVHCIRRGVMQFLSLRNTENAQELHMVKAAVHEMLRILEPIDEADISPLSWPRKMTFYAFWDTSSLGREHQKEKPSDAQRAVVETIAGRPILTSVAYAVLQLADTKDIRDSKGEVVNEEETAVPFSTRHQDAVKVNQAKEKTEMEKANAFVCNDLRKVTEYSDSEWISGTAQTEHREHILASSYSIQDVIKCVGMPDYTSELVCTIGQNDAHSLESILVSPMLAWQKVAYAVFSERDAEIATSYWDKIQNKPYSIFFAVCKLAELLEVDHALLVVNREDDGRCGQTVLCSRKEIVDNVHLQGFARCCLYPWVKIIIVQGNSVYQLKIKDIDGTNRNTQPLPICSTLVGNDAGHDMHMIKTILDALQSNNANILLKTESIERRTEIMERKTESMEGLIKQLSDKLTMPPPLLSTKSKLPTAPEEEVPRNVSNKKNTEETGAPVPATQLATLCLQETSHEATATFAAMIKKVDALHDRIRASL